MIIFGTLSFLRCRRYWSLFPLFVAVVQLWFHQHHFAVVFLEHPDVAAILDLPAIVIQETIAAPPSIINSTATSAKCFSHNSHEWLNSDTRRRLQNNPLAVNDDFPQQMILDVPHLIKDTSKAKGLMEQTLCHQDSNFLSLDIPSDQLENPTNETIHLWTLRLTYLATHIHQHLPALKEAQERNKSSSCELLAKEKGIGAFDFECPDAKFLVVKLTDFGLGAVMRLLAVNAMVAGFSTGRVVLFLNKSPVGGGFENPWLLASCDRRDFQCFYMPPSPCTITVDEVANATALDRSQARTIFNRGELPEELDNDRILLWEANVRPMKTPDILRQRILDVVDEHILAPLRSSITTPSANPHGRQRLQLLQKAAKEILVEEDLRPEGTYYYHGHNSKHQHAFLFYLMRPNLIYSDKIKQIVDEVIPTEFQPSNSIGLPIRASDKCHQESECMSFEQYMDMVNHTWSPQHFPDHPNGESSSSLPSTTILVTSESQSIIEEQERYVSSGQHHHSLSFPVDFVKNGFDTVPDSGNSRSFSGLNLTADEIMLSSISTLKVQLHAGFSMGNCCSNFHLLLFDFLKDGCGAAKNQVAMCLQEHEDPEYRLCCEWSKTEECMAKKP